jgi:hypothetical protein
MHEATIAESAMLGLGRRIYWRRTNFAILRIYDCRGSKVGLGPTNLRGWGQLWS